jgi:predicted transcriptional regulator of viral defense system
MRWDDTARRQSGMIRRDQLILLGYASARVDRLVADRVFVPTRFAGVYRSAGAPHTEDAETWAVVLGTRSVLSYLSAARWWELPVQGDGRVHVTRPDRQAFRGKAKVRIHRTVLDPQVVTTRRGLQVTSRRETLLDCLGWLRLPEARTLLDRAMQQHWLDLAGNRPAIGIWPS